MNDDLARRIAAAIDREGGVDSDAELAAELAGDEAARVFAGDVARIDRALRGFPEPARSDDAWEALATRIEQRFDETLMPMADPTLGPLLDDPDGRPPSVHKVRAPADVKPRDAGTGGAEYSLANLTKLGVKGGAPTPEAAQRRSDRQRREQTLPGVGPAVAPAGAMPPPVVPAAMPPGAARPVPSGTARPVVPAKPFVSAKPAAPPPSAKPAAPVDVAARDSIVELDAAELEVASDPPPAMSARPLAPEPTHSAKPPPAPAAVSRAPRAEPTPARATDERTSFPSYESSSQSPLTARPVSLDEERAKRRRTMRIGGSLAAAAVVGLAVVVGVGTMSQPDQEQAVAAPMLESTGEPMADESGESWRPAPAPPAAVATATPDLEERSMAGAPTAEPAPIAGQAAWGTEGMEQPTEVSEPMAEAAPAAAAAGPRVRAIRRAGRPASRGARPAMAVTAPSESSAARPRGGEGGGGGAAPGAPGTLSREEIVRGLSAVQPQVSACRGARGGVVEVQLTVGGSGRVRNALVVGEFAGTREGSCVARAVRSARFPEFSRDSLSLRYPFRL